MIETGTYYGDMVFAQKDSFDRVYSIELGMDLWEAARQRFGDFPHVEILQGDSGTVLKGLVPRLDGPGLFWLDGHYSGGVTAKGEKVSPIFEELDVILDSRRIPHVLLIDDARLFTGDGDYPGIDAVRQYVQSKDPSYRMDVRDDIIRLTKDLK
jgi:hypothetical protein